VSQHPYVEEVVEFRAGDGRSLNLVHLSPTDAPARGPVLLIAGSGVRANIFRPPVEVSLVDLLLDQGYDVWIENWRASIDFDPCQWTLDDGAVFDHPAAVQEVVRRTGADTIQAVVHCQGSTSFMMAAAAGLVPEVRTVVSNSVSLHPAVPPLAKVKLLAAAPVLAHLTHYLDPQWGRHPKGLLASVLRLVVRLTHHECDNPVCKMTSFCYGLGLRNAVLWSHEQLNTATHDWISDEFAWIPMTFFQQMAASVAKGELVPVAGRPELPRSFVDRPPKTDARFVFLTGTANRTFHPDSQRRTFEFFDGFRPDYHALYQLDGYGHLDVFIGERAGREVAPLILAELAR
jgi:hypothetical protein